MEIEVVFSDNRWDVGFEAQILIKDNQYFKLIQPEQVSG